VVRTTKPTYTKTNPTAQNKPYKTNTPKAPTSKPITSKSPVVKTTTKPIVSEKKLVTKPITKATSTEIKKIEDNYDKAKEADKSTDKETVYSKTEILEATTRVKVTTAMVLEYINAYKDIAKGNMRKYGIPSSIIIGQGILESGAGTGPLSILANNHFGIKCHKDWSGSSVKYDDDEAQECFRKYDLPSESYQDHALFLTNRTWYAPLFYLKIDDYKSWAVGLKNAGYATDPKYPEKLIAIIERYKLFNYDSEVLGKTVEANPLVSSNSSFQNNTIYQVNPGDTLYSISKKFNISIDDLKRNNDIQDNALSIGQNLKVK